MVTRRLPKLSLMQYIGTEVPRPIATPMRREHACPDLSSQSVSLLQAGLQESLSFTEADRPVWDIHSLDLEESLKTTACQLEVCSWNEDLLFAEALELYTDGSFDGHRAGWAVVILAHWGSHHAVLGTCSGATWSGGSKAHSTGCRTSRPSLGTLVAPSICQNLWVARASVFSMGFCCTREASARGI